MVKAIVFDCFDVLVSNGLPIFSDKYLIGGREKIQIVARLEESLNAGKINLQTFYLKLAELVGVTVAEVSSILDDNQPDEKLFKLIEKELKPNYKIGMLSNAGDDWLDEMIGKKRRSLFDSIVLSYDVGLIKPNPEIYRLACRNLGLDCSVCLMVDDKLSYCDGAKEAGMMAIVYSSFDQFVSGLRGLKLI